MKYQITAMDLHFIVNELNSVLLNARADKVFEPEKKEFLIGFHISGIGKKMLRIGLSGHLYLSDYKEEMPKKPREFALMLRKYISGSRLRRIKRQGFERIVELCFEKKEGMFFLIVELFSGGNMILTDENFTIKSVLEPKKFKNRVLRGNVKYEYPESRANPLDMQKEEFKERMTNSKMGSVVKALAIDFGLGGLYAEEICFCAGVDKNKEKADDKDIGKLYSEITKLASAKPKPNVVYENSEFGAVLPVVFKSMAGKKTEKFESLSGAFESVITKEKIEIEKEKKTAPYKKEFERLNKQKKEQEEQIKNLNIAAGENKEKGEAIYNNYQYLETLIPEIKNIIKKYSQKEIKEKLKNHDKIKEINFKEKTITIEI